MTLTNNDTVEFTTQYDQLQDLIELVLSGEYTTPGETIQQLDQITGIQQGPNFKTYIAWLIGRNQIIADAQAGGSGGGISPWLQDFLVTFNGVPDVITTIPILDDTTVMIEAHTSAKRTNGSGAGGFIRRAAVYREGGGPAKMVPVTGGASATADATFTRRTSPSYDSSIIVSGNDATITVTGKNAHTIDWKTVYNLSSVN